jgi:hypothetical protein
VRFHDTRHHAITELAESQTSDQTIMAIARHVSPRMLAHYSHVRLDAKRAALNALSSRNDKGKGYVTKRVTNRGGAGTPDAQVIENMVGTRRLELLTSTVSNFQVAVLPITYRLLETAEQRGNTWKPKFLQVILQARF